MTSHTESSDGFWYFWRILIAFFWHFLTLSDGFWRYISDSFWRFLIVSDAHLFLTLHASLHCDVYTGGSKHAPWMIPLCLYLEMNYEVAPTAKTATKMYCKLRNYRSIQTKKEHIMRKRIQYDFISIKFGSICQH